MIRSRSAIVVSLPAPATRWNVQQPSPDRDLEQDTESGWHAPCFRCQRGGFFQMYSILYIIGAIVVIVVVLRLIGLA
jgi:hypothetical protein